MIMTISVTLTPEESKVLSKEKIRQMIVSACKKQGLDMVEVSVS